MGSSFDKKIKGKHKGPKIDLENVETISLSRRSLSRIQASLFDPLGWWCGHISMGFKLIMREVAQSFSTSEAEFDKPINASLPELHKKAVELIKGVLMLQETTEIERTVIREDEELSKILISVDGSDVGHSAVLHFVLTNKQGQKRTKLVRAANKINVSSTPSNELNAYYLGLQILNQTLMSLVSTMSKKDFEKVDILFVNDSMSTNLQLLGFSHQSNTKRLADKIRREMSNLRHGLKHKMDHANTIKFVWLPSEYLVADINSKAPKSMTQSTLWKEGPEIYIKGDINQFIWGFFQDQQFIKDETFAYWNSSPINMDVRQITMYLTDVNLDQCQEIKNEDLSEGKDNTYTNLLREGEANLWLMEKNWFQNKALRKNFLSVFA